MLDLRLIREDPERVKAAIATTYLEAPIDEILVLDERGTLVGALNMHDLFRAKVI